MVPLLPCSPRYIIKPLLRTGEKAMTHCLIQIPSKFMTLLIVLRELWVIDLIMVKAKIIFRHFVIVLFPKDKHPKI